MGKNQRKLNSLRIAFDQKSGAYLTRHIKTRPAYHGANLDYTELGEISRRTSLRRMTFVTTAP